MKTRIYPIAMILLISLLSLTGSAKVLTSGNPVASGFENAIEPSLAIEGWMLNEECWDHPGHMSVNADIESGLNLENWMTDTNRWESFNYFSPERDASLEIETWMTNDLYWSVNVLPVAEVTEKELSIESWMTDPAHWFMPESR